MEAVRRFIYKQVSEQRLTQQEAKRMLLELQGKQEQTDDDIAIIGISGRFGGASNLNEYWQNLKHGVCSIGEFPKERRKDIDPLFRNRFFSMFYTGTVIPEGTDPGMLDLYHRAAYLDKIDEFDAGFFNIPPREAKFISPVQRVLLETSWEAVEDAGYGGDKITNSNTGVFVGFDNTSLSFYKYATVPDPLHETGSYSSILASRISYLLNLRGPAVVIDTACSSSMVALHLASQSLKKMECDMAIVGGIYVLYSNVKSQTDSMSNLNRVTSEDESVRAFDRNAKGTVWSEGSGTVLIKPLRKAISDRDSIYAVIKGSAINNDGFSNGITAPNADAQEEVIIRAWKEAKIDPADLSYIEAHGTGTIIGDPIEIKGLTNAFRRFTNKRQFCGIGSVKPNIGHTVAVSGLASMFKVILAMKHNEIPPSINFDEANPFIDFAQSPLYVNDRPTEWKKGSSPRIAGINAFGFSGTNCHLVLSEAPKTEEKSDKLNQGANIFSVSGRNEQAVMEGLQRYYSYLENNMETDIGDICFTAGTGRRHYSNRIAFVVNDTHQLFEKIGVVLANGLEGLKPEGVFYAQHKVVVANKKHRQTHEITEKEKKQLSEAAQRAVDTWIASGYNEATCLNDICSLYIKGAVVQWEEFYAGQNRNRVHLPAYPFQRTRYWADLLVSVDKAIGDVKPVSDDIGPLVDKLLSDSIYQEVFQTEFNTEHHWILKEHKVLGTSVLPGTAHLEMVMEACRKHYHERALEISNVVFMTPLAVPESEPIEVQLIIKKERDSMEFALVSKSSSGDGDNEQWTVHTEGKFTVIDNKSTAIDISEIKSKCHTSVETNKRKMSNFTFGPRWDNIAHVHSGESEDMLLTMQLPETCLSDLDSYLLHPALLDNAVNGAAQNMKDSGKGGMYLPLSYKSIRIYEKLPSRFFSYVKRISDSEQNVETKSYDILLVDLDGRILAEIEGYTIKRVHKAEQMFRAGYGYEIGWVEEGLDQIQASDVEKGNILVFRDRGGIADSIIQKMDIPQDKIIQVDIGKAYSKTERGFTVPCCEEDFNRLIKELEEQKPERIMYFSSVSSNAAEDAEQLLERMDSGILSLFYLTKVLIKNKYNDPISIDIFADFARRVTEEESYINPMGAAAFGLAKVAGQEYPQLIFKCIDIDKDTPIESMVKELYASKYTFEVALRGARRYIQEFREINPDNITSTDVEIKDNGAYIITGGLGSIGLEVAKHLASKNKVNLVLINRSHFPKRDEWDEVLGADQDSSAPQKITAIRAIEENGSSVECISGDISDYNSCKSIIDTIKGKYGRINGIIHSAGVAGSGFMFNKEKDAFKNVISPKILGTWAIDHLTRDEDMDFFIMFSSIAAVLGGAGQGDYTAANSYMDAYAQYLDINGRKSVSINWPVWTQIGMAVEHGFGQEGSGIFKPISVDNAMFVLDRILGTNINNIIPAELNYEIVASSIDHFPIRLSGKLKKILQRKTRKADSIAQKSKHLPADFKVEIKGMDNDCISPVKEKLADIWGRILEIREIDIYENFYSLGGDSLLAAQLMKELDKEYPGVVNIADIFTYSSIVQLGDYIEKATSGQYDPVTETTAPDTEADEVLKEMLNKIEAGESSVENALDILKEI